jgi:hypothetical protein
MEQYVTMFYGRVHVLLHRYTELHEHYYESMIYVRKVHYRKYCLLDMFVNVEYFLQELGVLRLTDKGTWFSFVWLQSEATNCSGISKMHQVTCLPSSDLIPSRMCSK